jgi:hypothetical protein
MGGTPVTVGAAESVRFPGVIVNLSLGNAAGAGGSQGSVVNHVGFIVNNVQEQVAKWKANGVTVNPRVPHPWRSRRRRNRWQAQRRRPAWHTQCH